MIDLHSHSLLSDGVLLPSELARRAEDKGLECIAITDHVDMGCAVRVAAQVAEAARALDGAVKIKIIPGVEITHVPPPMIKAAVAKAREAGARLIVVHGETIVEPVMPGTNRAAIEAGADVLAHPGLISEEDASMAAKKGVLLEISGRSGHCYTNGHVAQAALRAGASICFGSDSHLPSDIADLRTAEKILKGAGLGAEDVEKALINMLKKAGIG